MLNLTPSILLLTTAAPLAMPEAAHAEKGATAPLSGAAPTQSIKSGHVEADGISYYYEIRGQGEPLLLLHGGLGSVEMFKPILPILAKRRQVIGVDAAGSRAHTARQPTDESRGDGR